MKRSSSDQLITCRPPELHEAASNAGNDLLPSKSRPIYESAYTAFAIWRKEFITSLSFESIMMEYFVELSKKYKPSTLWSTYSMLKSTINLKEGIDIGEYPILTEFLKKQSSGFQSKKSNVFSSQDIQRFLTEAPDNKYLITKVVLIFGICGACRSNELVNIRIQDITRQGKLILVNLPHTKTKRPRKFVISEEFTDFIRKYEALRPAKQIGDRFFLNYQNGKCTAQVIGIHKFAKMPGQIATFLNLPDADNYTGHTFRRTSATLLADSGVSIISLKRPEGQKSRSVAEEYIEEEYIEEEYIEESIDDKTQISHLLSSTIHNVSTLSTSTTSATSPVPSTSSISATSLLPSEARGKSDERPPFKQQMIIKAATGASSTITTLPNKTTIFSNCSVRNYEKDTSFVKKSSFSVLFLEYQGSANRFLYQI